MNQEVVIAVILIACCVGLFIHYRNSVKSKSCSCCGSTGKNKK